ncbi:TPR domain-containing protein [Cyclospora cayetanensis]|uniref:TPR domain-containing protein n=1 Tax=Cyclospora cayetanensis TaxID=88456 RepID=A0A1D3CTE1_9EIME|nr:TPR domain-containing protein [Cyclospora cayetanensis]
MGEAERPSVLESPSDAATESDASEGLCSQSPSIDQLDTEGLPHQRQHLIRRPGQQGQTAHSGVAGDIAASTPDESSSGLPFRQVINAACTSSSLQRIAESFRFVERAPCICADARSCTFGGGVGQLQQRQRREVLRMLMQEDSLSPDQQKREEADPFSLFSTNVAALASSCCDRHAPPRGPVHGNDGSPNGVFNRSENAVPSNAANEAGAGCNWEIFAAALDKELDAIIDTLDTSGILEKMQHSLGASLSPAVFAYPKMQEARALEAASQEAANDTNPSTPADTLPALHSDSLTAASRAAVPAVADEETPPQVECGGIFAALAAVEAHCNEISKKFACPPPSLLQLRERRNRLHKLSERKGSWEVREDLPHVNASFPDAAWFSLGCCAGRMWRRLLLESGVSASHQLELLRLLQGDDLVEGCFVIDTVRKDRTMSDGGAQASRRRRTPLEEVQLKLEARGFSTCPIASLSRRVVAGRRGRREFMDALCLPHAVVRGWVVRCDRERDLMLLRLVGVEVYPEASASQEEKQEETSTTPNQTAGRGAACAPARGTPTGTHEGADYLKRRLLRAEVDIGSSGLYAALPVASIPRYEFVGGQASGCCGRFVCAGTSVRVCLKRRAAPAGSCATLAGGFQRSSNGGVVERLAKQQHQPLLDETTLNAAHAHVEASVALPEDLQGNPTLVELLQEPLGFSAALPYDAAHPQPEEADFEQIHALQMPSKAESREPLRWWDGGSGLLQSRLPYMLRSSGAFMNPVATHRRLHAFSALHLLGMALAPQAKVSVADSNPPKGASGGRKRATNDGNMVLVYTEAEAWEAALRRLGDGCFMSLLNAASPCEAIRCALARAERNPAVRAGGIGRLLAQEQGADWAKRRLKAGVVCARRGYLDQALQLYDSALQLQPNYADALIARGAAYANKLDYEKAAADLDAALALEPANKNAAKYRAIVAERMEGKECVVVAIAGEACRVRRSRQNTVPR